jgi:hypothetical protein
MPFVTGSVEVVPSIPAAAPPALAPPPPLSPAELDLRDLALLPPDDDPWDLGNSLRLDFRGVRGLGAGFDGPGRADPILLTCAPGAALGRLEAGPPFAFPWPRLSEQV